MDYTNGLITDYGNHRFDSVHQIMGEEIPLTAASSAIRFNKRNAGDLYDMQQATFEYPSFVLSYEACNYNGHGLGGRTPGMRYYNARGTEDRPHGKAFYGTEERCSWTASAWSCIRNLRPDHPAAPAGAGAIRARLLWPLPPGPPVVPRGCT